MRGADKEIISVLKEGAKTPKELWQACSKLGLKKDTYRRHRIQLIKLGIIEEAKYKYVGEMEANPELILDCIEIIKSDISDTIRIFRAKQLERLCYWKRTAYAPNLLNFLKTSINDENEGVRENLVLALTNLLRYEQKRTPQNHRIIHRILDENLKTITKLACSEDNYEVRVALLKFLGYTGDVRALEPIFKIIKNFSKTEYDHIKQWIHWILFTPDFLLAKRFKREVSKRLDNLFVDSDEQIRTRAEELHSFMISPNGMQ